MSGQDKTETAGTGAVRAGQDEAEHFAFIRGMLHFGNWGRNWQRVRTGLSECFELEEDDAAAVVERFKAVAK